MIDTYGVPPPGWERPPDQRGRARRWSWSARNLRGEAVQGEMEAHQVDEVEERLKSLGWGSIQVRRAGFRIDFSRLRWWISRKDRSIVSRQLQTMLEAGLPLALAVRILEQQHLRPVARRLRAVGTALESGMAAEDALAEAGDLLTV